MRLLAFNAAEGDCILLTSADGHHALIDGGRAHSFKKATLPVLQELAESGEQLDLVCVSHIDRDHIEGILHLLDLAVDW
jgi:beta-lactamase superfamily II metal-dependent hydrolase